MSTEHDGKYCAVKDKMCLGRTEAGRIAGRMGNMMAYKCTSCKHWHLAHKRRPLMKGNQRPKGLKSRFK
jgi:hypothetical protein